MKKRILIYQDIGDAIFIILIGFAGWYLGKQFWENSALNSFLPLDDIFLAFLVCGIFCSLGYYEISDDIITKYSIPFIPFGKINVSDCVEIGLVTKKSFHSIKWTVRYNTYYYTDHIYFSDKELREDQREDYRGLKFAECKIWPYNKKLHAYLTDTLGIELEGKLTEKEK